MSRRALEASLAEERRQGHLVRRAGIDWNSQRIVWSVLE
jgi:hypothetical protein